MFSKEIARHADACRFCWMCRHICPVAGSTGNESWTPRAKGLLISMIERGTEYDAGIADVMYHCTFCDACANDCVTGYRPSEFIRAARTQALVDGIAPASVTKAIETIMEQGNIFGEAQKVTCPGAAASADTLLYLGQTVRAVQPEQGAAAAGLLAKAGVAYMVLDDEPASGAYLGELMGYTGDVQTVAAAAAEALTKTGASKLVVLNPADAQMFKEQYAQWGLLSGMEIVTYTAFVAELLKDGKLAPKAVNRQASLQEPVKLTRGIEEEAPAKALIEAAGIENIEMFLNGKMSRCVGTVPFEKIAPETTKEMVRVRTDDARRMGSSAMVTVSPDDYYVLNKYAVDMEILDLFTLLNEQC